MSNVIDFNERRRARLSGSGADRISRARRSRHRREETTGFIRIGELSDLIVQKLRE